MTLSGVTVKAGREGGVSEGWSDKERLKQRQDRSLHWKYKRKESQKNEKAKKSVKEEVWRVILWRREAE